MMGDTSEIAKKLFDICNQTIIGLKNQRIRDAVLEYRAGQTKKIIDNPDPRKVIQKEN